MGDNWQEVRRRLPGYLVMFAVTTILCFQVGAIVQRVSPMLAWLTTPLVYVELWTLNKAYWRDVRP